MKLNVSDDGRSVRATLSRRNLLSLLHKLDMEGSQRTLIQYDKQGRTLWVVAEDDDEHYAGRRPGEMHPETEAFVREKS